ncbi:HAD-IIIA family hydrolase [Amycolatopsis sp.]|uniref:HAD-IIIA family hydrolase n=1 Tax=Amycolatopsis sp. TaxID=37632 RepID=UPI002E05745E|nr:HAD-IIIA family hydrolase [Amycolatopsis sp.]
MSDYTVVIPTTRRENVLLLLKALREATGPAPAEIIVVDDRPEPDDLGLPQGIKLLKSGGRGPAAARNVGWQHASTEWIAFLDDDVLTGPEWPVLLVKDLLGLPSDVGASKARIVVPLPADRRPTDEERGTAGLEQAQWITADMAYRRDVLVAAGGFDERFPRAFREDSDLALRVSEAGYRIVTGRRTTTHPAKNSGPLASLRAQRGNADNALMRHKHGRTWRERTKEGKGRLGLHALTTAAMLGAIVLSAAKKKTAAAVAVAVWAALTTDFAARRIHPGPRTRDEVGRMLVTSALIPPAACAHRIRGEFRFRGRARPQAVLFDRDDTVIVNIPYLADPALVEPMPGAVEALRRLRSEGIRVGMVSNQSGVARGLVSREQLRAVNARAEELLGPFGTWQICVHGDEDGCACRKPAPGLVRQAALALGVDVRRCVVVGDILADVTAATSAGARGILVPTKHTLPAEVESARLDATVARDVTEAVELALGGTR